MGYVVIKGLYTPCGGGWVGGVKETVCRQFDADNGCDKMGYGGLAGFLQGYRGR
jgi:hypothetical protein